MNRCVLHVSGDYPDQFQAEKTPVIQRLVGELSGYCRNVVISINRVGTPDKESIKQDGDVFSVRYFSPPLGLFQTFFLDRLTRRIVALLDEHGVSPDIAIGHKFTIESYIVWRLAKNFRIPYVAAFMGNSDRKIYRLKPHYRRCYRQIAREASGLVFPTPWCRDYFSEKRLVDDAHAVERGVHVIPYISADYLRPISSRPVNVKHFVVVCRLDVWRIKNLHRLIEAIATLRRESSDWQLDIVGSGSVKAEAAVRCLISKHGADDGVRMLGGKRREEIDGLLPAYSAMVMPSYPESFGLVYLEALAQGVPVMTAKNSGFDGFFPDAFPGVVVPHDSIPEIVKGLRLLAEKAADYRAVIAGANDELAKFDRRVIVERYRSLLELGA